VYVTERERRKISEVRGEKTEEAHKHKREG